MPKINSVTRMPTGFLLSKFHRHMQLVLGHHCGSGKCNGLGIMLRPLSWPMT